MFKDIKKLCTMKYGDEKGMNIYLITEKNIQRMLQEADYRNSEMIQWHMSKNIFPVLAYYMALLESGYSSKQAYENTLEETDRLAQIVKKSNKKLARLPFFYMIFKALIKRVMGKSYPDAGWETEWIRRDQKEIHFNLKRCVYFEVTSQYGHPELCKVFCNNDTTAFSGYMPKVKFERSGTISEGAKMCDFHFKNSKYL